VIITKNIFKDISVLLLNFTLAVVGLIRQYQGDQIAED